MPRDAPASTLPPVVVRLPLALVRLFPGSTERVEVTASTVSEAIGALELRWPGMRDRLCDSTPRIRRNIHIYVGGKRASLDTRLAPGAEVWVTTAIIG
jgi:hypothetical protein